MKLAWALVVVAVLGAGMGLIMDRVRPGVKCPANPIDFQIEIYKQGTYVCAKSVHIVGKNYVIECVDPSTLGFPYYNEE